MKKLLIAAVVLMFLPKAHAQSCSVTITPPSFTLQTGHTQAFAANLSGCSGGSLTWTFICTPSGNCGSKSSLSSTSELYTAPSSLVSQTVEAVTLKATYGNTTASANITVNAVQINALTMPSGATSGDVSAFQTYVLGSNTVAGINPFMVWNQIESSNSMGTGSGGYDFTAFDTYVAGLFNPAGSFTKKINILALGISGGCAISGSCGNTATPAYVFTSQWASTQGASTLDVFTCTDYPGNGSSGSGFPAVYEKPYYVAYENFISAVLQHYSNSCSATTTKPCSGNSGANGPALAPYIGYIRFGLSAGGEVFPFCASGNYNVDSGGQSTWTFLNYINTMDQYIVSAEESYGAAQQTLGAYNVQMMTSINQTRFPSDSTPPDTEAADAVNAKQTSPYTVTMGFGSQGLQKSDVSSYHNVPPGYCTSDWCALFNTYTGQVPLELQTTLQSDPTGVAQTGSLATLGTVTGLIPFATSLHANILELYPYDLLYALDTGSGSAGYCGLHGATTAYCTPATSSGNPTYGSSYLTSIQNADAGK
jgi:hypothetical protein